MTQQFAKIENKCLMEQYCPKSCPVHKFAKKNCIEAELKNLHNFNPDEEVAKFAKKKQLWNYNFQKGCPECQYAKSTTSCKSTILIKNQQKIIDLQKSCPERQLAKIVLEHQFVKIFHN